MRACKACGRATRRTTRWSSQTPRSGRRCGARKGEGQGRATAAGAADDRLLMLDFVFEAQEKGEYRVNWDGENSLWMKREVGKMGESFQ